MIGITTPTALLLPDDLSEDAWRDVGLDIGGSRNASNWHLGDWWAFGENHHYGTRKALVESPEWRGPSFKTCHGAGTVARAIESARRRALLSYTHHQDVAALEPALQDACLEWCLKTNPPATRRELRDHIKEIKELGKPRTDVQAREYAKHWMAEYGSTLTRYQREALDYAIRHDPIQAARCCDGELTCTQAANVARANSQKRVAQHEAKQQADHEARHADHANVIPLHTEATLDEGVDELMALMQAIERFDGVHVAPAHLLHHMSSEKADEVERCVLVGLRLLKAIHSTWRGLRPDRSPHAQAIRR